MFSCSKCDDVLHLPKSLKGHVRKPLRVSASGDGEEAVGGGEIELSAEAQAAADKAKEELRKKLELPTEDEVRHRLEKRLPRIETKQGGDTSRAKFSWLHCVVYDGKCLAVLDFKRHPTSKSSGPDGTSAGVVECRFCHEVLSEKNRSTTEYEGPGLQDVCNDEDCEKKAGNSCGALLECGHPCYGVKGESVHMPCFQGCDGVDIEGEDMCGMCYTESMNEAPCVHLGCGHNFHAECARARVNAGYLGPEISWKFLGCASCRQQVDHPALADLIDPLLEVQAEHHKRALLRLRYEELESDPRIKSDFGGDKLAFALHEFDYMMCFKCSKPYFGGKHMCRAAGGPKFDKSELVCAACQPMAADAACPKHGTDFIQWRCQFCCAPAVWYCFGTTHFCDPCHRSPGTGPDQKKKGTLPKCPAGPLGKPLGKPCPFGGNHAPIG